MTDILEKLQNSEKSLFVGIAGPGTGKSYTFKKTIESEEFKDKKILILSFINKLVDDLKNDFSQNTNVTVSTLHSFALKQIGDVDLEQRLDQILSEDFAYINGTEIDFEEKLHENSLSEKEEDFYRKRRDFYKWRNKLYSLNSVVYAVNKLFYYNESKIPSDYDLILVDEFQDFNACECEFIAHLNKKCKIILVGDENQSLYFFKKARPDKIIELYKSNDSEEFSLDYCYRCTKVIINAVNDLVKNAKEDGFLTYNLEKKFLYPEDNEEKDKISEQFSKISFIPAVQGDQLIYKLEQDIKKTTKEDSEGEQKRVLILVPSFLRQIIYDGLIRKGFNIVDFELFGTEKRNNISHKNLIDAFDILSKRKTDSLALRKILGLYLGDEELKGLVNASHENDKKFWSLLTDKVKEKIESDIELVKKAKQGENDLNQKELIRLGEVFHLKKVFSRLIKGFAPVRKSAIEIEMTTVVSSKGLSADYVYYVGVDDEYVLDRDTRKFTDSKICEVLVGISRAKRKLTLVSLKDKHPKVLDLIGTDHIDRIEDRA